MRFRDQRGAILTSVYILALVSLITISAFSMNTAIVAQQKIKLNQAIEAIAVAMGFAGDNLSLQDYQRIRDTYVNAFYPQNQDRVEIKITAPQVKGDPYSVSGSFRTQFLFSKSLRGEDINVAVKSDIKAEKIRDRLEVALVLDVSGSMAGDLPDLKASAKDFVSELFSSGTDNEQVYISLAPFDHNVNIGEQRRNWTSGGPCVRAYRNLGGRTIDHILDLPQGGNSLFNGGTDCNSSQLLPLSNQTAIINQRIDSLTDSGFTEIDNGLAWAWRTLSPQWQGAWQEVPDRPLTERVKKVVVIFTDGNGYADAGVFSQMCQALPQQQPAIEVFAIQFGFGGNQTLEQCAQDTDHYYQAGDAQALQQAFRDIAEQVGFVLKLSRG